MFILSVVCLHLEVGSQILWELMVLILFDVQASCVCKHLVCFVILVVCLSCEIFIPMARISHIVFYILVVFLCVFCN